MTGFVAVSCDDVDDIVNPDFDRLFSPVDLKGTISNMTGVKVTWTESKDAEAYILEVIEGGADESGEKVASYTVTPDEIPYTVIGLEGETEYTIRVKATTNQGREDSKWSTIVVTTGTEQIFLNFEDGDIDYTEVTLRWTAGEVATKIMLTPGDIEHTVTASEIAAGQATITGLIRATQYKATLLNGTKTRGTKTFETRGAAIEVTPTDDFATMIAEANDEDVFSLAAGEYSVGKLSIKKSITIKGANATNRPVLKALLSLEAGVSFELKDIILNGADAVDAGANADQAIQFNTADVDYGDITITGCEIKNYLKGLLYFNQKGMAESITIDKCIIYDIECNGGDFFDCRKGTAKQINFTNNTVYNSALARDFFRIDNDNSSAFSSAPKLLIDHNTFNNVSNGSSRRMLYVRWVGNEITFTNNILANTDGYYTNQAATNIVLMRNNNYHNAPNFTGSTQSSAKNDTGTYTTLDPGFANVANGDFTLSNSTLISNGIGDPQWIKE